MRSKSFSQRKRRKVRIRKKVAGTAERPRLSIFRSNKNLALQVIDDASGKTIASAQTTEKELRAKFAKNNQETAAGLASILAERAKGKGVSTMVFDRNGYAYHGNVKKVAESLRENGITI